MSLTDWISSILILLILIILFIQSFQIRIDNNRRERNNERFLYEIMKNRDDFDHLSNRNKYTDSRYGSEIYERLLYELRKLPRSIVNDLSEIINDTINEAIAKNQNIYLQRGKDGDLYQLVSELSHSLFTPISQIEAATILLLDKFSDIEGDSDVEASIQSIKTSVSICKSILAAYKEQVSLSTSSGWSIKSLDELAKAAIKLYGNKTDIQINIDVKLPHVINGYTNNYLIAVLIPLIENAVESSKNDDTIQISYQKSKENHFIMIQNKIYTETANIDFYITGKSTKNNHEGIGLSVVQNFLALFPGTSLSHDITDNVITFVLTFPIKDGDNNEES